MTMPVRGMNLDMRRLLALALVRSCRLTTSEPSSG
jgi:hypothetical protein